MEFLPHLCVSIVFGFILTIPCMFSSASPAPCEMEMSVEISSPQLLQNESILDRTSNIFYPPGTYWELEDQEAKKYMGCPCKLDSRPCLRKCCPLGKMLQNGKCVEHNTTFAFNMTDKKDNFQEVEGVKYFSLIFRMLFCDNSTHVRKRLLLGDRTNNENHIDSTDGRLVDIHGNYYDHDSYCMEYFENKRGHHALACVSKETSKKHIRLTVYPIFMSISIAFLSLTLFVYAILPELRNLHGKCLMCQIVSLIFGYVFLSVSQLAGGSLPRAICVATAFIIQFSFLSTFFWLNVMSLEIFFAFSGIQGMSGFIKEKERKKFIWYSLYAWSCPVFIVIISMVMEFSPGIPYYLLKPRFAVTRCWFKNKSEALMYFYGPQALLLTSNIIMFIITAFKIVKLNKQSEVLRKEGCRSSDEQKENRHRFILYLKLLVVMGVTWIMDLIEWAVDDLHIVFKYGCDIVLLLQGVLIFLIFVWKDKIIITLLEKFCPKYAEKRKQTAKSRRKFRGGRSSTVNNSTASSGFSTQAKENVELKSLRRHDTDNTHV